MAIFSDVPRKYAKNGKRWAHVFSPDLKEMKAYAQTHGLKRRDCSPWPHYDVTDEELKALPDIEIITHRSTMVKMMNRFKAPRTRPKVGRPPKEEQNV